MVIDVKAKVISVVPALSLTAYSAGDQMGVAMKLSDILDESSDTVVLSSIIVIDKAKQKSKIDILFFDKEPVLTSVDNAALSISDAEMVEKFIGRASVLDTVYVDTAANSDATVGNLNIILQGRGSGDLWCVLQCQGTPTYLSDTDLMIRVCVVQN